MESRSKTRIDIIQGAYVFWRYNTAWLDARPLGLGRQSLHLHDQDQAIRKAVEIISKSKKTPLKSQAAMVEVPKAEAIIEQIPDPGYGEITLEMALTMYVSDYKRRNRVSSYIRTIYPLKAFLRDIGNDKPVSWVSRKVMRWWFDRRVTQCSASTANSDLTRIHGFFAWMVAEEFIERNPVVNIKKVRISTVAKPAPTSREVQALIDKAKALQHPWLADYVTALAGTGARPQEILRARLCDFEEDQGLLRIMAFDGREIKTGKDRTIAVSSAVKEALARRKKATPPGNSNAPLFPAPATDAKFTRYIWRVLGKNSMKPYYLRHHFCTMAPTWGWSLVRTAAYVGNSIQVLERFYQDRKAMQLGAPPALEQV